MLKIKSNQQMKMKKEKNVRNLKYISRICDLCNKKDNKLLKSDKPKEEKTLIISFF